MNKNLTLLPGINTPGHDLDAYMRAVSITPILNAEEEKDLAEKLFYQQDLDAARKLVLANLRFVIHIAKSYSGYGLAQNDIIQEGNIGLMKAVKRFDPSVGVRLISFAVHWIKAEIHEYVIRNWRIVKIATTKAQRKLFFNLRSKKQHLGLLTQKEATAMAKDLGVKTKDVFEMESRLAAHDAAFDLSQNDDDDHSFVPARYLAANDIDPAEALATNNEKEQYSKALGHALVNLDERSRDILSQRWLSDNKVTLHDLAEKYEVSAERIRQIESNAMKKMKKAIEEILS